MIRTMIEAKVVFAGLHRWTDAHPDVDYLSLTHRHLFVIRARKVVTHDDRQIEFIMLGQAISRYLEERFPGGIMGTTSCEQLARLLLDEYALGWCSVHEDDENGAIVERLP